MLKYLHSSVVFIFFTSYSLFCNSPITITSFNIRREGHEKIDSRLWKYRKDAVVSEIKKNDPDILCLQEPVKRQITYLAGKLQNYSWVGKGRGASWAGKAKNEYNPIFYKKHLLELINKGTFHINNYSFIRRKTEGKLPRICTWALFKLKSTGRTFYVFNTHLDNEYDLARKNGLKKVIHAIKARVPKDATVFLTGDFNVNISSDYQVILNEVHLVNTKTLARKKTGPDTTHESWSGGKPCIVDHILARAGSARLVVQSYDTGMFNKQSPVSDHVPVSVKIVFE